jgi:hypothetical protein
MNQVLSFPDTPAATRAFAAVRTVMSSCTTDKGFTTSGSEDEVRVTDLDALTRLSMHRLAAVSQRTDTAEPSDSPRAEVGGELTGFGATRTAWESQHGPEVPNNNDDAYGTKVDDEQYEYSSVSFQPRVLSYLRAFPRHTTLAEAETILLRDFPSDAGTSVTDKDERRCRIVLIESARLQDVLGDWAIASFYGRRQAFDADDVAAAYVTVHRSRRARDLGVC